MGEIMDNPACDEIAKLINNTFDIYLKTYWVKQHVTTWWQIQWFQADWAPDLYCICIGHCQKSSQVIRFAENKSASLSAMIKLHIANLVFQI